MTDDAAIRWIPDTLSGLITAAAKEARSIDRALYHPDARHWHEPIRAGSGEVCAVCLAGMYVARVYAPYDTVSPWSRIDRDEGDAMHALNAVRRGDVIEAADLAGLMPDTEAGRAELRRCQESCEAAEARKTAQFRDWKSLDVHLDALDDLAALLAAHDL